MQEVFNNTLEDSHKTGNDLLKEKVRNVKSRLPKNWRKILVDRYPEYDSLRMGTLLNNVFNLRATDVKITSVLEEIASEFTTEK